VCRRVGLGAVKKEKNLLLPKIEPRPYPVATPTELSRLRVDGYSQIETPGRRGCTDARRTAFAECSLRLFFDSENGARIFLRNVGLLLSYYLASHFTGCALHSHRRENLKSYGPASGY
jgi:hypothetical protein